jgi:hypothetical protein
MSGEMKSATIFVQAVSTRRMAQSIALYSVQVWSGEKDVEFKDTQPRKPKGQAPQMLIELFMCMDNKGESADILLETTKSCGSRYLFMLAIVHIAHRSSGRPAHSTCVDLEMMMVVSI